MTSPTLLSFAEFDIPPYSARGISERFRPIGESAQLGRTVNGELVNLLDGVSDDFKKFELTITCTDQDHPVLDTLWPGDTLTVSCATEFKYRDTTDGTPARTAVDGSERTEGGYVYYRPILTMMVASYDIAQDEFGADIGWTLELVEV